MASPATDLADAFLSRANVSADQSTRVELSKLLSDAIASARGIVSGVAVEPAEFASHLAARYVGEGAAQPDASEVVSTLQQRALSDCFLAYACSRNDAAATRWFVAEFESDIDRIVAKAGQDGEAARELKQSMLIKLMSADQDAPPKLASYSGQGPLRGFVRVVASRMVVDHFRRRAAMPKQDELDEYDLIAEMPDPEVELLRVRYRDEVRAALQHALATLDAKDRRLLRNLLVHRVPLEELGAMFGVHRTTAARWAEQARRRLMAAAKADLVQRLGTGVATVDSIVMLVRGELELSVARLLSSTPSHE